MTTKEEVKIIATKQMFNHVAVAIVCLCADAYLSSMLWASIVLWVTSAVCLTTVGFIAGVVRTTEKLSK